VALGMSDASPAPSAGARPVTPVQDWTTALEERGPSPFEPAGHHRVTVVAAHPYDETLGASGCLQALHRAGARITLAVATDGEAAYPALDADGRRALARARRLELTAALRAQGLDDVDVHWLGLPDSGLEGCAAALRTALRPLLADADAYLAPWDGDPHPDHRAVGLAAADVAPVTAHGWAYPIWMWAWLTPDDAAVPWGRARVLRLDAAGLAAKRDAIAAFTSQIGPGPDGSPPVLDAAMLAHTARPAELLFRIARTASAPVARFAELYADGADPWRAGSWYERRKRAVVLASLPRERYRRSFEPGCGTGELTRELAARCDAVLASDPVADAVRQAREQVADRPGVRVERSALPDAVPEEPVDLAVFSEVLYYLDDAAVEATLDRTLTAVEPGGDVVVVHWRGWPAEAPRDAVATHRMLRARPELTAVVEHVDDGFVLLVLRRR
jgi:LmbE family N-acetylglucosaminyl deacetylase